MFVFRKKLPIGITYRIRKNHFNQKSSEKQDNQQTIRKHENKVRRIFLIVKDMQLFLKSVD